MNEIERDYIAAKAVGLELVALVLRLWVIVFCVFTGLWVLGVILMYWYVIIPVGIGVVWWASRSPQSTPSSAARLAPNLLLETVDDLMSIDIEQVGPHEQLDQIEATFAQLNFADERLRSTELGRELLLGPSGVAASADENFPQFAVGIIVAGLPHRKPRLETTAR